MNFHNRLDIMKQIFRMERQFIINDKLKNQEKTPNK
jgi:hypothetical protein